MKTDMKIITSSIVEWIHLTRGMNMVLTTRGESTTETKHQKKLVDIGPTPLMEDLSIDLRSVKRSFELELFHSMQFQLEKVICSSFMMRAYNVTFIVCKKVDKKR